MLPTITSSVCLKKNRHLFNVFKHICLNSYCDGSDYISRLIVLLNAVQQGTRGLWLALVFFTAEGQFNKSK